MTEHKPSCVVDELYKETNMIHYVCKLGNVPILQVCIHAIKWNKKYKANL